jgi:hypothetical protein
MSENLTVLIERKEGELSIIQESMEELKNEFIKKTISFASEWFKKTTKEYVTQYSEVTLGMKEEKIVQMKTKVNELMQNTEKIVWNELGKPALWWHQRPRLNDSIEQYLQVADKYPEILDRAIRYALGRLGLILEEYRYNVTTNSNKTSYPEFWFDQSRGNNSSSIPFYPHLLQWSQDMQDFIRKYNNQYINAMALFKEIQRLKEEKEQRQALSRWDSI